jgi:hypothetical protein
MCECLMKNKFRVQFISYNGNRSCTVKIMQSKFIINAEVRETVNDSDSDAYTRLEIPMNVKR